MTESAMSGCDQRILNWLSFFLTRAEKITVITSKQGALRFKKFSGIKVIKTTGCSFKGTLGLFFSYLIRTFKGCRIRKSISLDRNKKNVIYSASDLITDAVPALSLKLKNKDSFLIVGLHLLAPLPWKGFRKYFLKGIVFPSLSNIYYFISQGLLLSFFKKFTDLVLVSNEYDRKKLIKKGFNPERVLVSPGAIDSKIVEEIKSREKIYEACYVGRFHSQKGFIDLIEIWKRVADKVPGAKLIVIGYDINLQKIKDKVKKAGLYGDIVFKGFVGGIEKYALIKQAKLALVPSYYESFGMVILEALSCGVPVVCYNLPLYKNIYTKGVVKVGIGKKEKFSNEIISLLKDEVKRNSLSEEGRALSKKFNWEDTAQNILDKISA